MEKENHTSEKAGIGKIVSILKLHIRFKQVSRVLFFLLFSYCAPYEFYVFIVALITFIFQHCRKPLIYQQREEI